MLDQRGGGEASELVAHLVGGGDDQGVHLPLHVGAVLDRAAPGDA